MQASLPVPSEEAKPGRAPRSGMSNWSIWGYLPAALAIGLVWVQGVVFSQTKQLQLNTGKEIYEGGCIACHGPDGRGTPQTTLGFEPPDTFPDFSDCNSTTREPDIAWSGIIHNGGKSKGFSPIMPAFRELLTDEQIQKVINHLRTFCKEPAWPTGEMNLPRAIYTEKAFPEDELVLTTSLSATGDPAVGNTFVYEKRFGLRDQLEVTVPFNFTRPAPGTWYGGPGDSALGWKHMLASSRRTGSIFSVVGETSFATGNKQRGLGNGVQIFEGFGSYGQILPKNAFLQFQGGGEFPTHTETLPRAAYFRSTVGTSFYQNHGYGRAWSPMVEFLADRDFEDGAKTNWDVVPEVQVTLNKRQHIRASAGVKIPMNNRPDRATEVVFYLLWDIFDGGIRDGW